MGRAVRADHDDYLWSRCLEDTARVKRQEDREKNSEETWNVRTMGSDGQKERNFPARDRRRVNRGEKGTDVLVVVVEEIQQ